jgi:ribonuclease HI
MLNKTYKESCVLNPSSTKSESYAILIILLVVPNNAQINIYTDSQNCIHNYIYFTNPLISRRKQLNHNNHLLWTFMIELIKQKNLTLTFHKVKAHSNDPYNDITDELTTQELNEDPINLHFQAHATNSLLLPTWNSMGIIDTNLCKWMKKVLQARIFNNFIFNNNFSSIRNTFSNIAINWEYTALWINHNHQEDEITSSRFTRESLHKIKSITYQLPTSDIQSRNYPILYNNLIPILCSNCNIEQDDNTHIGRCHKTKTEINLVFTKGKNLLFSLLSELEDTNTYTLQDSIDQLQCLQELELNNEMISESHYIYLWAHNLIPNDLIIFLQSYIKKVKTFQSLLWKFLDVFIKLIKKTTWLSRCHLMNQWERQHNITKKSKRTYNTKFTQKQRKDARAKATSQNNGGAASSINTANNSQHDSTSTHNSSLF